MSAQAVTVTNENENDALHPIIRDVLRGGAVLFRDEQGQPTLSFHVRAPGSLSLHLEVWPVSRRSRQIFLWLHNWALKNRKSLKKSQIREVIEIMEMEAHRCDIRSIANRFASQDKQIYLDMADGSWRAIKVSPEKWEVISPDKPLFRRFDHQIPLCQPDPEGKIEELFELLPVQGDNERLLILAWLVAAIQADLIKPILVNRGQPGSGKTMIARMLRSLIDPSTTGPLGELERSNLTQVMFHHAVPCFDNLGDFSRREADFFCRSVTGAGVERRRLFTDSDQVIYTFRRAIILNGLEVPSKRPDFLDRCLVFNSERISQFRSERDLSDEFTRRHPRFLGGLLNLAAKAMRHQESESNSEFRMTDFLCVGRAVAKAQGKSPRAFDNAYRTMLQDHINDTFEDDHLAYLVSEVVKDVAYEGTAKNLLEKLLALAERKEVSLDPKIWPRTPGVLSARLIELAPVLATRGIAVTRLPRNGRFRRLKITKS